MLVNANQQCTYKLCLSKLLEDIAQYILSSSDVNDDGQYPQYSDIFTNPTLIQWPYEGLFSEILLYKVVIGHFWLSLVQQYTEWHHETDFQPFFIYVFTMICLLIITTHNICIEGKGSALSVLLH